MPDEAHANCRFYVEINDLTQAVFTEMNGLQVETVYEDVEEGGNNEFVHRLPGRMKVGNLTLKRGITKSNDLFQWCASILRGKIDRRAVTVRMFNSKGEEMVRWNFVDAYPVKWTGPEFAGDGHIVAMESLELAHSGLGPP